MKAGLTEAPVYPGAGHYAAKPLYDVAGVYRTDAMGTFRAELIQGARWQLPIAGPFGVALLLGYDRGRDEDIRTLGGHDTTLRGMGNLGSTAQTGFELSYSFAPVRLYVKGLQAVRDRDYGGENLGYTAHLDVGGEGQYPLDAQWSLLTNAYLRWGDGGYERGGFGVTAAQASQTDFAQYRASGGVQQVTAEAELNYQWTPAIAFQSGVEATQLTGDAADSPLVKKSLSGVVFMSASYRF
ncbi:MipA/OmpV family protein [Serratia marcescens]|nr:MipA/OmpV family protein [Serratia marcescens]MBH2766652.1 MipA/OmpV family protein [Serratia marcescens]MBH2766712.1 MipA/OmpV family protein [Serratia marcescens]